ncbi:MAG: L,D-transpeptidase [Candidatus Dormibacteraeota bacterium]|nr:L,D-transpeptidase [Candidatus Dormibacteraeota bacterium]
MAILAASLVALTAAFVAQASAEASSSLSQVESARQQLNLDLLAASSHGYSQQEVGPVLERQQAILSEVAPSGSSDRAVFYRTQAKGIVNLRVALSSLEVRQLDLIKRATATRLNDLVGELAQDSKLGVDPAELAPLQVQVDSLQTTLNYSRSPADYRRAFTEMGAPIDQAQQLRAARAADLAAVQTEADRLQQANAGSVDALRQVGLQALADGRNFATSKAYLRLPPGRSYDLIESDAARLDGQAVGDVALAAALLEHYRDRLHNELIAGMPHKLIVVSILAEELWAYEDQKLFVNTLVTTGLPQLPTDKGLMRIARKESPVHFVSPFPKGSTYDYGTIDAKYALWFQPSGEAIHDSWWRSWYGPGSNLNGRGSHGCIGVPYGPIDQLYRWGDVGTPVMVIPGDGSTVANQLSEKTYDDPNWGTGPITQ